MIVFIEIPHGAGRGAFDTFRSAVGEDRVGWLGRNATMEDFAAQNAGERYAVVGGEMTLADTANIKGASLVTTVVGDPAVRLAAMWSAWETDDTLPGHWIAHTFNLREAIAEKLPEVVPATEGLARQLRAPGVEATVPAIVAGLKATPVLIGFAEHPNMYARTMERRLGTERGTIDRNAFREPSAPGARNEEMQKAIADVTANDRALRSRLLEAKGEARMLDSRKL